MPAPTPPTVKRIAVEHLRLGMYIHDLNCSWMDHPFMSNTFAVKDAETLAKIVQIGVRELYIDTAKGLDVEAEAVVAETPPADIQQALRDLAEEPAAPRRVALAEEIERARRLHSEANLIVRDLIGDIRLGKQIELEQVDPLVENMVDSIFRCPDALLPLGRLKDHDNYTFLHSVSVCTLMIAFAHGLGLERAIIKEIAVGALLHDVGKAKVPDAILNKPAKLTDAEFAKMKSHVVQSRLILLATPGISQIALDVASQHHERYDGTGYPNGLKGERISLYGRMAAIVDVYDAISSNRVYHKGMPPNEALAKLLEWSKYHFDPELVRHYIKSVGIYPTGSLIRLESGRLAVVLEQHKEQLLKPVVKVMYHAVKKHYLPPETLDLSKPDSRDRIAGGEDFEAWGIDPKQWLPG